VTKLLLWKCTRLSAWCCTLRFSTARRQPAWELPLLAPVAAASAGFTIAQRFKTFAIPGELIFAAGLKATWWEDSGLSYDSLWAGWGTHVSTCGS